MTNVPQVTFGPNGFIVPPANEILQGVQEDINAAFGGNLNPALNTPQGQLATSMAALVSQADETFLDYTNQVDPAYAKGRMQDAIARIYFLSRLPSQPTVLQVVCSGAFNVTIPIDSLIKDSDGNTYTCTEAGVIPITGSITLTFANLLPGPIAVPSANSVAIYQTIPGWDSVTVASGVVGQDVESRSEFEIRRAASVASNSVGSLPSVLGAVLKVPGVLDAYVTENDTNTPVTILGATLAANSLYVAVTGGVAADVAQAIWSKKAPGCNYNGNTTVVVYDTNSGYNPPYPSYSVSFEIPPALEFLFAVSIANGPQVPSNATALIQQAILSAFAGGDGGQRARIGGKIFASRYYTPVALLGAWAQINSILVGSANTQTSSFTGVIAGTTLTTSGASGTIAVGQTVIDALGDVAPGTVITGGSGTSWTVSVSQTISSRAMKGVVANLDSMQVNINQGPVLSADNILVTLV